MKTYNLKNETLNGLVNQLSEMAVKYDKLGAKAETRNEVCTYIGALSAVLDKLAEVMGGLWLYGEDFANDADEIRRFVQDVQNRAECLAEVADVDNITIIFDSVAAVIRWINKGEQIRKNFETAKNYGVHVHTVEVLRDIETLTDEEAREKYTAEELAKAQELAEREELDNIGEDVQALTAEDCEKMTRDEIFKKIEEQREKYKELGRKADEADNEGNFRKFSVIEKQMFIIEDNLIYLESALDNIKEHDNNENETESDNDRRDENHLISREILCKAYENTAKASKLIKTATRKTVGVSAAALCICVGFAAFYGCVLFSVHLEAVASVSIACWVRLVLMLTVFIDVAAWAELNTMALFDRLNLFEGIGGIYGRHKFMLHPVSILGLIVRNIREA